MTPNWFTSRFIWGSGFLNSSSGFTRGSCPPITVEFITLQETKNFSQKVFHSASRAKFDLNERKPLSTLQLGFHKLVRWLVYLVRYSNNMSHIAFSYFSFSSSWFIMWKMNDSARLPREYKIRRAWQLDEKTQNFFIFEKLIHDKESMQNTILRVFSMRYISLR